MEKLKAILRHLFLITPFFMIGGLELILLHNRSVRELVYRTAIIRKSKKELDKKLFGRFMKRVTK